MDSQALERNMHTQERKFNVTTSASTPLTRSFHDSVIDRLKRRPEEGYLYVQTVLECLSEGDPQVARAILRNDLLPVLGLEKIAAAVNISPATLRRNVANNGNPGINRFSAILTAVSKEFAKRKLRAAKRKLAK
jgi:DNA-binding phage protein